MRWIEIDGVIYFKVVNDGTTGRRQWPNRLKNLDCTVGHSAERMLLSGGPTSTTGETINVAVLKDVFPADHGEIFTVGEARDEAGRMGLTELDPEVACIILDSVTSEELAEMGLNWIVVMGETIDGSDGVPSLLGVGRNDCLGAFWGRREDPLRIGDGCAFEGVPPED